MPTFKCSLFLSLCCLSSCFLLLSCQSDPILSPRPRAYPKVEYPKKEYQPFNFDYCNFSFEYPKYSKIIKDTLFFDETPVHPCWFDILFDHFGGRVHCSYYPINKDNSFEKLKIDQFKLADKHIIKANSKEEYEVKNENGVSGFIFNIQGPTATPFMFFLSDSTNHFLRGALYFNTQSRPDSMAPVHEFVKKDIVHMINTFNWE